MVAAALIANVAIRAQVANVAALLAIGGAVAVLWRTTPLRISPAALLASGVALGAGVGLVARASSWLVTLNSLTALAALSALGVLAGPNPPQFTVNSLAANVQRLGGAFFAPKILFDAAKPRTGLLSRAVPVLRGLVLAFVPVLVLGALLASADAVFAKAVSIDVGLDGALEHGVLTAVLLAMLASLVAYAGTRKEPRAGEIRLVGAVESLVVLGSVAAIFALFAATQLASALGQTDAVLSSQGVSHAEYARSGYFQLLWVATLTALLLAAVRLVARPGTSRQALGQRACAALVALLTCVIVASAIVRLGLYTDEFGQTTLRWYSAAFAWMLGAGFVLTALAGLRETVRWLPLTLVSLTAATLLVVNVVNPEARIADHNLDRAGTNVELDADYLVRLSSDAWPVLLDRKQEVIAALEQDRSGQSADQRFSRACDEADASNGYGLFGFNLSLARLDCAAA